MRTLVGFFAIAILALWLVLRAQDREEKATARANAALVDAREALVREALAELGAPATRKDATIAVLSALEIDRNFAPARDALIAVAYENRRYAEATFIKTERSVEKSAFSHDGKYLAITDYNTLLVIDLETGEESYRERVHIFNLAYTAHELVVVTENAIIQRSVNGKDVKVTTSSQDELIGEVEMAADARIITTYHSIWKREGNDYVRTPLREHRFSPQLSPDGEQFVGIDERTQHLTFLDTKTQTPFAVTKRLWGTIEGVFSPNHDGYVVWGGQIARVVDLPSGNVRHLFEHDGLRILHAEYSLNGSRVFVATPISMAILNPETDALELDHYWGIDASALAISPDQRRFARTHDNRIELVDFDQIDRSEVVGEHDAPITSLTFSSHGPHLLSTDRSGTSIVWRLDRHGLKTPLKLKSPEVSAVGWDGSDRYHAVLKRGPDDGLVVWNLAGERVLHLEQSSPAITAARLWPDVLFVADESGDLGIYDPKTMKRKVAFPERGRLRIAKNAPRALRCWSEGCQVYDERGTAIYTEEAGWDAVAIADDGTWVTLQNSQGAKTVILATHATTDAASAYTNAPDAPQEWPGWAKHVREMPLEHREMAVSPDGKHALLVEEGRAAMLDISYESTLRVTCAVAKKQPDFAKVASRCR